MHEGDGRTTAATTRLVRTLGAAEATGKKDNVDDLEINEK